MVCSNTAFTRFLGQIPRILIRPRGTRRIRKVLAPAAETEAAGIVVLHVGAAGGVAYDHAEALRGSAHAYLFL